MTLNLYNLIKLSGLPVDDVVAIRHTFNQKETKDVWDKHDRTQFEEYQIVSCRVCPKHDRTQFEEYQSIQPGSDFFKSKRYVLSFIADGKTYSRFIGCYEIIDQYPAGNANRMENFLHPEFYERADHIYFKMVRSDYMSELTDRLVIDWGKGTVGYVQYSKEALEKKPVISIFPDSKHVFPGYNRVRWDFKTMQEYVTHPDQYEEIANALKEVYAVYLVVDQKSGKYYVGSAYGRDGLFGRWLTYASTNGTGGGTKDDDAGNIGVVEYLKENPGAYLDFQYSILEIIHKTGINEKDIAATLDAEKIWKQKLCTFKTPWGLNRN